MEGTPLLQHSRGGFLHVYQTKFSWRSYVESECRETQCRHELVGRTHLPGQDLRSVLSATTGPFWPSRGCECSEEGSHRLRLDATESPARLKAKRPQSAGYP